MPQQNALLSAFNSGEFSPLMLGRVDFRRYAYALETGRNVISTPQGVLMTAPGTSLRGACADESKRSWLTPWEFSDEVVLVLEWSDGKLRFYDTTTQGLVLEVEKTVISYNSGTLNVTGHGWSTGDTLFLSGFAAADDANGRTVTITSVTDADNVVVDHAPTISGALTNAKAARVYELTTPYAAADLHALRLVRELDNTYVYCGVKAGDRRGYKTRLLQRAGTTDWTLTAVDFEDGPYLSAALGQGLLTPSALGGAVPLMTAASTPSGQTISADSGTGWNAFDGDLNTTWQGTTAQTGWLQVQFTSAKTVTGYSIRGASSSVTANTTPFDQAPNTWRFEGSNDGSTWTLLDRQVDFVAYEKYKTPYIELNNPGSFEYYRLTVEAVQAGGAVAPVISALQFGLASETFTLTADATAQSAINGGSGFTALDVDRLLRFQGSDLIWRALRITARTSATVVTVTPTGEPLPDLEPALQYRLGMVSDQTGHPVYAFRFKSRQHLVGMRDFSSFLVGSESQTLDVFSPSDKDGLVLDSNGFALDVDADEVADIRWGVPLDKNRGVILGTGTGIYGVTRTDTSKAYSGTNLDQDPADSEGTSRVQPVKVKQAIIHLSRDQKSLLEMVFSFQEDGFVTRDLTQFASHIGQNSQFEQIVFLARPYPILVARQSNGDIVFAVYDRLQEVLGLFTYDFGGGDCESMAAVRDPADGTTRLWLTVKRTVGATTRRFVEQLEPFWREGSTIASTHFVQAGIRYEGAEASTFYGLHWFDGGTLVGLANGAPITAVTAAGASLTLPRSASSAVFGLGFDAEAETVSPEAGAAAGTSQGASKRANKVKVLLFDTQTLKLGKRVEGEKRFEEVTIRQSGDEVDAMPPPFSGFKDLTLPGGNDLKETILLGRDADKPLPFNIVMLVPQVDARA